MVHIVALNFCSCSSSCWVIPKVLCHCSYRLSSCPNSFKPQVVDRLTTSEGKDSVAFQWHNVFGTKYIFLFHIVTDLIWNECQALWKQRSTPEDPEANRKTLPACKDPWSFLCGATGGETLRGKCPRSQQGLLRGSYYFIETKSPSGNLMSQGASPFACKSRWLSDTS